MGQGEGREACQVVRHVGGAVAGGDDLAAARLEFLAEVAAGQQVQPAGLVVGQPPAAEQGGVRTARVEGLDQQVAAGAQGVEGGVQFGARVGGALQVVQQADHVVAAGQPGQHPGVGERPHVGLLDPAELAGPLDARGEVGAVERGVREELPRRVREAGESGADVQPALRFAERQHRAGRGAAAVPYGVQGEDTFGGGVAGAPRTARR